jgi:hypothetical protein
MTEPQRLSSGEFATDISHLQVRNISNSEVTCFLTCKRMYEYAFVLNLAPKELSKPLTRGTLGHLVFQYYVEARLNSSNHEKSLEYAQKAYVEALKSGIKQDWVLEVQMLVDRYMNFHQGWPSWKLLGTEERLDLQITDTLVLPIRYDLYYEDISTGKCNILDFKFTYDFWSPDDHSLNPQMPKYISVMQANGLRVDGGILEEVRTRPLGKEKASDPKNLWRRTRYFPTLARRTSMLRQHVATALEIEAHRALPEDQRKDAAIPVLNKHGACKYCNFKDLCSSELEGKKDLTVDIRHGYEQNTYGYNLKQLDEII